MDAAKLNSKTPTTFLAKTVCDCCPVFKILTGQVLIILEIGGFRNVLDWSKTCIQTRDTRTDPWAQ